MKKIVAFALTAVMTLALLVGCGDKTNNDANTGDDNANGGTAAAPETEEIEAIEDEEE